MFSSTNFWMGFAGLFYLFVGAFVLRREIGAARGIGKLVTLGTVFVAASLAAFAPEHFHGPEFIQGMVPSWMPVRHLWPAFIGCALLAAATSLATKKWIRLSASLLALMFALFVCVDYLPSALRHPGYRFGWVYMLRDSSFAAGALALAGLHRRGDSPRLSSAMISFGRIVMAVAAIYFAAELLLYPGFSPGVPAEMPTPSWVPFPKFWGYLTGAVLLVAGIPLALDKKPRMAAVAIGALTTALTVFLYVPMLALALSGSADGINEALNYIADTLLYAGMALALASALGSGRVQP
jgi:hypothetical protein